MDSAVVAARLVQFVAAVGVFGSPLFFLYALGETGRPAGSDLAWGRRLLCWSAALLLAGALAGLFLQTAVMAGDPAMALNAQALGMVLTGTAFGPAILARILLAAGVLAAALWMAPRAGLWRSAAGAGALILASFAWTGHGAAEDGLAGAVHAVSDILHLLAAGVWLGALVVLAVLSWRSRRDAASQSLATLHRALEGFSGVGSLAVAVLLASGLVNSAFLVGLRPVEAIVTSLYGQLLLAKIALFGLMLLLAATHRFRLTPRLGLALRTGQRSEPALAALRRSLLLETALGVGVLALVSVLGAIAPLSAQM